MAQNRTRLTASHNTEALHPNVPTSARRAADMLGFSLIGSRMLRKADQPGRSERRSEAYASVR